MSTEKYIVVFKDSATPEQIDKYANGVTENGGQVHNRYDSILKGFSAAIPETYLQTLQSLQGEDDIISYIEPDGLVTTQ